MNDKQKEPTTMIKKELKTSIDKSVLQQLLRENEEFMKPLIQSVVQEVLEAQMSAALGADKGERTAERLGYRSGYYTRWLITRVGRIELRVPQDRQGRFSTEVFERYQRSEKALVSSIIEMYVQGVSTRKVKKVAEQLCGYRFSASTVQSVKPQAGRATGPLQWPPPAPGLSVSHCRCPL